MTVEDRMDVSSTYLSYYSRIKSTKGEDTVVTVTDLQFDELSFSLFAVFDGHGGPQAAIWCRDKLENYFLQALESSKSEPSLTDINDLFDLFPDAMKRCFERLNTECCAIDPQCGTTATLVALSPTSPSTPKWARICIANVGDSHAYLKIGSQTIRLNEDHRLDSSTAEQDRIREAGGEVTRQTGNSNVKDFPLRQWPGGLMMGRTLGDPDATYASGIPAIRNFAVRLFEPNSKLLEDELPLSYRLIVASDGLWDNMSPKSVFQCIDKISGDQAAVSELMKEATKRAGKDRDDISIILVEVAGSQDKGLRRRASSSVCTVKSVECPTFVSSPADSLLPHDAVFATESCIADVIGKERELVERLEQERLETERALLLSQQAEMERQALLRKQQEDLEKAEKEKKAKKKKDEKRAKEGATSLPVPQSTVTSASSSDPVPAQRSNRSQDFDIVLSNLARQVTNGAIKEYFSDYGEVQSLLRRSPNFAFLSFVNKAVIEIVLGSETHLIGDTNVSIRRFTPKTKIDENRVKDIVKDPSSKQKEQEMPQPHRPVSDASPLPATQPYNNEQRVSSGNVKTPSESSPPISAPSVSTANGDDAKKQSKKPKKSREADIYLQWNTEQELVITKSNILAYFQRFGQLSDHYVKFENKKRGYAMVTYKDKSAINKVLSQPNPPDIPGGESIMMKRFLKKENLNQ